MQTVAVYKQCHKRHLIVAIMIIDHECLILILDELLHHTLDHSEALVSLAISHVHASLALVVLNT